MTKSIKVHDDTYDVLLKQGTVEDSMDDVIRSLLKLPKRTKK